MKIKSTDITVTDDTGWEEMTLLNGWVPQASIYATAGARRIGKLVLLKGAIGGGTMTNGTIVCVVPDGLRPPKDLQMAVSSTSTDPTARLIIRANGNIQIYGINVASIALDGSSYFID